MPRNLNAVIKEALLAQQTDATVWVLIELSGVDLATPMRLCSNNEVITRAGVEWNPAFFEVTLPVEADGELAKSTITIQNVDRILVDALRSLTEPLAFALYIATSADEAILVGPFEYTWRESQYDSLTITGSLEADDVLNREWPSIRFTPSRFQALFR